MRQTSFEDSVKHAIVVTPDDVTAIAEILENDAGVLNITAGCRDGMKRTFESAKELCDYDNTKEKRFVTLRMAASSGTFRKQVVLSFADESYRPPLMLDISGDEGFVIAMRDRLQSKVARMRPWYAFVAALEFETIITYGTFAFIGLSSMWSLVQYKLRAVQPKPAMPPTHDVEMDVVASAIALMAVILAASFFVIATKLRSLFKWFFPRLSYALGNGKQSHAILDDWRRRAMWSGFLSMCSLLYIAVSKILSLAGAR